MRKRPLLLAPILVAGCVLTSPTVSVTKHEQAFELAQLARSRVAVWPVATAKVDPAAAGGLTEQYGSEEAFLDSVARTMSGRLVRSGGPPSLRSDDVVAALRNDDATRPLLDSRRLLGAGAESRFSGPSPELAKLSSLPALQGIRYAVLFPGVSVDLEQGVWSSGAGHSSSVSTVRWARGRVHVAVVDLGRGAVVWEGDMSASGKLSASGMKQIQEGLGTALDDALNPAPPASAPRAEHPPCDSNVDCERGVCISGRCR